MTLIDKLSSVPIPNGYKLWVHQNTPSVVSLSIGRSCGIGAIGVQKKKRSEVWCPAFLSGGSWEAPSAKDATELVEAMKAAVVLATLLDLEHPVPEKSSC